MDKTAAEAILNMVREYGTRRAFATNEANQSGVSNDAVLELNRRADAAFEAIRFTLQAHVSAVDPADAEDTERTTDEVHR